MHKVTFYPLGNADTCLIELENGEKLLFDFADVANPNDPEDKRIDLAATLKQTLSEADRNYFDVVAFTHLDDDHTHGSSEFFNFEHAKKYQGTDRIHIGTLYVPAAVIIEEGCEGEAAIIRAEARYRLREGKGIRVFSRPGKLEDWLEEQGLSLQEREHLITDAGQLVPEFSLDRNGVEFFVHSPFASRLEDGTLLDRNTDALAVQATFLVGSKETKLILSSDLNHEAFTEIVNITKYHGNEERLEWDIFKIPHHCSYLSLSPEKGKDKTEPVPEVKWLLEEQGRKGALIISPSKPIPTDDSDAQPPHRQAANYYKGVTSSINGEFVVTMQRPNISNPDSSVIEIDGFGATLKKVSSSGAFLITSRPGPRAG